MSPEEALQRARAAADAGRPKGLYDEAPPSLDAGPAERMSTGQLVEWSLVEPRMESVYSTRRAGAPMTVFKRFLARLLRQYIHDVTAQQSRYNAQAAAHILHLEERVRELEDELRAR